MAGCGFDDEGGPGNGTCTSPDCEGGTADGPRQERRVIPDDKCDETGPEPVPVTMHPRLFLTAADVPRLRSWAVASNPIGGRSRRIATPFRGRTWTRGTSPARTPAWATATRRTPPSRTRCSSRSSPSSTPTRRRAPTTPSAHGRSSCTSSTRRPSASAAPTCRTEDPRSRPRTDCGGGARASPSPSTGLTER